MSHWDRAAWALLIAAIAIGANAINEAREHELATAAICAVAALGLVGLWRLVRRYQARR
jgi:hypothetical protein